MAVPSNTASKTKISTQKEKTSKKDKSRTQCDDEGQQKSLPNSPAKRQKCTGIRVVGGRIYDSENGKTCHQCRQKTRDFVATCKNQNNNKPCTIKFCHKCLLNRYGENAEDMALLDDWKCPKCRGICNCSFCMKKRGHKPTGMLVHTAKATGFSSVSEMLHVKGPDKIVKFPGVSLKKPVNKENAVVSPRKRGKENSFKGNSGSNFQSQNSMSNPDEKKAKKMKQGGLTEVRDGNRNGALSKNSSPKKPQVSKETPKKMKQEGLKEVCDGNRDNGALSKNSNPKKPQVSKETPKKIVKENGKDGGAMLGKKDSEVQVSKEVSTYPIKKEEKIYEKDGATHKFVDVSDSVKIDNGGGKPKTVIESHQVNECTMKLQNIDFVADTSMPQGTELTTVMGIELLPEDVGHALQFLEFCAAFGKVFGVTKRQAECVLQELVHGRSGRSSRSNRRCRGQYSSIVWFHTQLLSLILKDMGEESPLLSPTNGKNSWLQALGKCVSESQCALKELPSDCFSRGGDGYYKLDLSKKLKLLNFLCDETLGTAKLRSWIDDQNSKFVERGKKAKEKVIAAKDKEKHIKQRMLDEVAKAIIAKNGASLSISEHETIVSQIKIEAARAHAEMLEAMGMVPQKKQRPDAVRTQPILLDVNGHAYWRLKGYPGNDILLQEMETWDAVAPNEKWFYYDTEQKTEIEKYISSRRKECTSI